jgi:hypothetical protein
MSRSLRENGLALFFFVLFLGSLVGQALAGHHDFNQDQLAHDSSPISILRYLTSSAFGVEVLENWQSEYLQFTLYVLATVWLLQRGSPESKPLDQGGRQSQRQQRLGRHADQDSPRWARTGGVRTLVYSNSLLIVMGLLWLGSWAAQAVTGRVEYNATQLEHQEMPVSLGEYVIGAEFWERTLQNWQSEFLAIGSMAILSVYLRQRGSPESKPVGAAHITTGAES